MFLIDKTFEFCYGHRVWTQTLDGRFSDDLKCACRHLHGHEAKVQVFLEGETLNPHGMVTDFRHLEWLKKWLNQFIDHQFIIDINDPLFPVLFPSEKVFTEVLYLSAENSPIKYAGRLVRPMASVTENHLLEMFEGVLVVDFPPTSEHLAKWLHGLVQYKMNDLNVKVRRVDWYETPKSRSSYIAE